MDHWQRKLFRISKDGKIITPPTDTGEVASILERHTDIKASGQNIYERLDTMEVGTAMKLGDGIIIQRVDDADVGSASETVSEKYKGH